MINRSYKKELVAGMWDTIIIGSGIGGLTAASFLARQGWKVLVLEGHYVAGGFTHTFSRKGYEWDVGVHYIGEVQRPQSILRKIFDVMTDGKLEWAPMPEVYDRVFFGQPGQSLKNYDYVAGRKNFIEKMVSYFPQERSAIEQYVSLVMEAASSARGFFATKALPGLIEPVMYPFLARKFRSYSDQTTYDVLSRITQNQELIGVLTAQFGDYGLTPKQSSFGIHAMVARHYMDGGNYPIGGSSRIAETIIPQIENAGGKVLVRAPVQQILTRKGKAYGVRLANGDEIEAKNVVSDAGVINTLETLLDGQDSSWAQDKIKEVVPSLSHVCLYVGFKKTASELNFGKANFWIYPGYDHDANFQNYLKDPNSPVPVAYVSFPSAKDPSWDSRYPGRSTMEVVGFAPYEWFQSWENKPWMKRGDDYNQFKKQIADRLLERVEQVIPGIRSQIDYLEVSSPLSTRTFCHYKRGEIYGIDHTPDRFRLKWLKPATPVKNLYLTGQDITTDGVTGALFAGVLTASVMLKKNLISSI